MRNWNADGTRQADRQTGKGSRQTDRPRLTTAGVQKVIFPFFLFSYSEKLLLISFPPQRQLERGRKYFSVLFFFPLRVKKKLGCLNVIVLGITD